MEQSISVIIPVLNEERRLEATLRALRAMGECEVIVVDGGSADRSLDIARGLADKAILSERGRGTQMLMGAREASGDILLFVHADCVLPDGAFDMIRGTLSDGRAAAFDICIDAPGLAYRAIERAANLRSRMTRIPYGDQTLSIRRSDYERAGCHPQWPLMEDIELGRRLKRSGLRVKFLKPPAKVSARRWQRRGIIRTTLTDWALCIAHIALRVSPWRLASVYYGRTHGMRTGLIIFAKSPLGDVKTRLSGVLARDERSALAAKLITRTIERLGSVKDWDAHIAYAPDGEWFGRFGLPMFSQEGEELGERMHNAMQRLFDAGYERVVLVGGDIPELDACVIREALGLLESSELVLGPALDGGYYLVGATRQVPEIFRGITWSQPHVLDETLERAKAAGISTALCRTLRDLDTPEDLMQYLKDTANGKQQANRF